MTETTLKVLLGELERVRIVCRKDGCGGVVEIPIGKLKDISDIAKCPACGVQLVRDTSTNPLHSLGNAIQRILELDEAFAVELPVLVDAENHASVGVKKSATH